MASARTNATSYKKLKEDFVSNLSGGSVWEINQAAVLLWSVLQSRQSLFKQPTIIALSVDFLLNVCAILLSITLWASTPLLLNALLLSPILLLYALPKNFAAPKKKPHKPPVAREELTRTKSGSLDVLSVKPFLTQYRGCMMVVTCLAILAVDFRLFPRRFAKVETWGTSLMDVGVGSFVFSAGVVAARPVLKERAAGGATTPILQRLLYSLRHSVPLLVLGFIRLLSVKATDYAEHVTEYGVHWNFFFTLGFLPPFVALFQSVLKVVPSYAALAILLGVLYQVLLESTGLKAWILVAPRINLVSMNREGLCSFVGYLAIFLAGQDAGMYILPRKINANSTSTAGEQRNTLLLTLFVWTGIWCGLLFFATNPTWGMSLDVSRRLANLPYVLWIVAFNNAQILGFCVVDSIFFPSFYNAADSKQEREAYEFATSRVLRCFNRNGLAIFLVANLLTGLVNLSFRTLDAGPIETMGILVAYGAVVTAFAVALDAYNLSIKL